MSILVSIIDFSPERLAQPGVIVGIVLMVLGLVAVFGCGIIAGVLPKKEDKPDFWHDVVRIAGVVLLFAGGLTAVLCA